MNNNRFDIVIAGGGLVGSTLALALSQTNPHLTIAVIEAVAAAEPRQPGFDSRCIAIAQGTKQLLDRYGLWSGLSAHAQPIRHIEVSDRGHIGKSFIHAETFHLTALGYVLSMSDLGAALTAALAATAKVQWFRPAKVAAIEPQQEQVLLTLDNGDSLEGALLLAADGDQSATRQLLNIDCKVDDYHQHAVIANVQIEQSHQDTAYERFTDSGPMALLPLERDQYSLVWCVRPDKIEALMGWDDQQFIDQLQLAFGYRAGVFTKVSRRHSYPLALSLANDIVSHRAALIGNSAHTIHPIAGQGFNLGMRDIDAICALIGAAESAELGGYEQLRHYAQLRQPDLKRVVGMTDSLVRLFSNDNQLLALGRSIGLLSMQWFDGLKQPLANQAMGLVGQQKALEKNR